MQVAGVIAEYNPFHTGHAHQLAETRRALGGDCGVVCVMSGNWVQQAGCAVADKWTRARLALLGGADLVLELPTVWATASAEGFAGGGVELLCRAGVVDVLSFGSECGDVEALTQAARTLDSPACQEALSRMMGEGLPFPVARQRAAAQLLGTGAEVLSTPNNNLGVEYLRALARLGSSIRPMTVLREGAGHNQRGLSGREFASATQLRQCLQAGDWAAAEPFLPAAGREVLRAAPLASLTRAERAVLQCLRDMGPEDWARLPDAGEAEGLPCRLARAGRQAGSLEEFFELAKTKRYTHARIRRLALAAWLGITRAEREERPACLRVLGLNGRGREVLREMKARAGLPVVTRPAAVRALGGAAARQLEREARRTDRYDLCLPQVPPAGREWRESPVVI